MSLKLLQPSTATVVSLEETKSFMQIEHDVEDNLLKELIKMATHLLEVYTGRSFLKQKWLYKCHLDLCNDLGTLSSNFDGKISQNNIKIPLVNVPIMEITKVTFDGKEVVSPNFKLESIGSEEFLSLNIKNHQSKTAVELEVEYFAGYGENLTDIPYAIRLAVMMMVSRIYKDRWILENEKELLAGIKNVIAPFRIIPKF